jgi:hypothetical protein
VSGWALAAFRFLALGTDSDEVDSITFHLKTSRQPPQCWEYTKILLFDVSDGLAMRTDHVVVEVAIQFDSERAMVHADFF